MNYAFNRSFGAWANRNRSVAIYTATLTSPYLSTVAGTAFLDNLPAAITDLVTAYGNSKLSIELFYSGLMLKGVMASVGPGEVVSATDKLAGFDFTSGWVTAGTATVNDANTFTSTGIGGVRKGNILTTGALYKLNMQGSTTATVCQIVNYGSTPVFGTLPFTGYGTSSDPDRGIYFRNTASGQTDITTATVYQVTAPSTSGVILESSPGAADGTVSVNQGIAVNQTTYQAIVRLLR